MGRIKCLECGAILESKYRHDFQSCMGRDGKGCPNGTFVDGGNVYLRMGGKDLDKIKIIQENDSYLPEQL